jgi:hypothetical protein
MEIILNPSRLTKDGEQGRAILIDLLFPASFPAGRLSPSADFIQEGVFLAGRVHQVGVLQENVAAVHFPPVPVKGARARVCLAETVPVSQVVLSDIQGGTVLNDIYF